MPWLACSPAGLTTNLHFLEIADKVVRAVLRQANVAITQACYIKVLDSAERRRNEAA
jgi:hypothetical protein